MQWMLWGFAGLAAGVAVIIGAAMWIVLWRDRDKPNQGVQMRPRAGAMPRSDIRRGVPKSR